MHPGTPKAVMKKHFRDAFGNIIKTRTTAANMPVVVSETWYDSTENKQPVIILIQHR